MTMKETITLLCYPDFERVFSNFKPVQLLFLHQNETYNLKAHSRVWDNFQQLKAFKND